MEIEDVKQEINCVFSQSTLRGSVISWAEVINFIDNQQLKIKDLESEKEESRLNLIEIKESLSLFSKNQEVLKNMIDKAAGSIKESIQW